MSDVFVVGIDMIYTGETLVSLERLELWIVHREVAVPERQLGADGQGKGDPGASLVREHEVFVVESEQREWLYG